MEQASEANFLASRKDFLTLDSTPLANRNQEIKFGNGRGKQSFIYFLFLSFVASFQFFVF